MSIKTSVVGLVPSWRCRFVAMFEFKQFNKHTLGIYPCQILVPEYFFFLTNVFRQGLAACRNIVISYLFKLIFSAFYLTYFDTPKMTIFCDSFLSYCIIIQPIVKRGNMTLPCQ